MPAARTKRVPRRSPPPLPIDYVASAIVTQVRERRGVARRDLPKVAPSARVKLEKMLRARGLEVTPSAVRIPAREQLLALLRSSPFVEEKGLAGQLALVTPAEVKRVVQTLLEEKAALRVERPTGAALALPPLILLDAAEAVRLVKELEGAIRWLRRAVIGPAKRRPRLLRRDLLDLVARLDPSIVQRDS